MIKYSNYNSSGIEWFGNIPKDWKVRRLKNVLKIYGRIGYRGYTVEDIVDPGEGCIALSPSNIKNDKLVFEKNTYITWFKYEESPEIQIFKGDVVYVKTGSTIGKVAYVDDVHEPMTLNPQNIVFKEFRINSKYLYYTLQNDSSKIQTKFGIIGGATPALSQEKLGEFKIVVPNSLTEQTLIANYLDEKTSKLDLLISNKKEQIKRLKEIRQIEINTAVTKGLDPNAKLKPSGVEWLGDIPEHWKVRRIKDHVSVNVSSLGSDTDLELDIKYLDISNVNNTGLTGEIQELKFFEAPSRARRIVKNGDVVMSTVRPYLKAITYLDNIPKNMIASTGFAVMTSKSNYNSKFLFYQTVSDWFNETINSKSVGASYPALNNDVLVATKILFPPLTEQLEIANYLDNKTSKIDQLVSNLEKQINQLQEIRKIEIYNAVTGKIKVA